jgi:hypothetical protein
MEQSSGYSLAMTGQQALMVWCASCAARVKMVTVDQAAALMQVEWETIYWGVQARQTPHAETPEGLLLICLNQFGQRQLRELSGRHRPQRDPGGMSFQPGGRALMQAFQGDSPARRNSEAPRGSERTTRCFKLLSRVIKVSAMPISNTSSRWSATSGLHGNTAMDLDRGRGRAARPCWGSAPRALWLTRG